MFLAYDRKEQFEEHGHLTDSGFAVASEPEVIRRILNHLLATSAGRSEVSKFDLSGRDDSGWPGFPRKFEPSRCAPELQDLEAFRRAGEITRDFIGCGSVEMGRHMIFKPPILGGVTPWHQDQVYRDPTMDERSFNFRIMLDDTDVDNGCMQSVPGSNKLDVLPRHSIGNDPGSHGLEVDEPGEIRGAGGRMPAFGRGCRVASAHNPSLRGSQQDLRAASGVHRRHGRPELGARTAGRQLLDAGKTECEAGARDRESAGDDEVTNVRMKHCKASRGQEHGRPGRHILEVSSAILHLASRQGFGEFAGSQGSS